MAREKVEYIIPTDLDDIPDGTTYKKATETELTKLAGIEAGAEVNPSGLEMQTAIVAIADADRVLVGSEPVTGQKKVYGIAINASGNIEADQNTTPV